MDFAQINGARIALIESGRGANSMLLVHGWACDHTALAPQFDYFSKTYRVIAVDLRGHGISDKPHQEYTVPGFADDLARLCEKLQLQRPIVVGHSMGGTVALDLAGRYGDLISAAVLIDSVLFPDAAFLDALQSFARELDGETYREALYRTVSSLFLPSDDPDRKLGLLRSMANVPQHVLSSSFRNHITDYDPSESASGCQLPVAYIGAAGRLANIDRLAALCPQLVVGRTLGSGHFSPLEVPEQINAMIERFCANLTRFTSTQHVVATK